MLLQTSSGHIERAWAYDHYAINCDGVKGLTIELEYEIAQSVGNEGDVGLFGPLQYQPYYHIAFVVDSKNKAKRLRKKLRKWLYTEIAKIEQPPFDPKEVIEAAAADQEGMDAAESLLDREQMRFEMGRKVHDFQSAVHHLYKALDAGYAKDDEIAALKKENKTLLEQYLEVRKYAEALERGLGHSNEMLNQCKAAEPKDVQPAPVRLPVAGDTVEVLVNRNLNLWTTIAVDSQAMWSPMKMPSMEDYGKTWRWPEPRTRTAADAKQYDRIWYINGSTGKVEYAHVNSVGSELISMIPISVFIADFGTQWGYAEEQSK